MIVDVTHRLKTVINCHSNSCVGGLKLGEEQPNSATKMRLWKFCHGKIESSDKTQGSYSVSAMFLPDEDFKVD